MRRLTLLLAATVVAVASYAQSETELYKFLKSSKDVTSVEALPSGPFAEKYVVKITQPLDHNSDKGTFTQRFVVGHIDKDSINVFITEGYVGDYSLRERYREEISNELNTNMICVEHRYFSGSTPDPINWDYLTSINATADLHRINTLMKGFYGDDRWLATGISKGGQTTIQYRTYYPDDVQVSVPYVAPICWGVEDGRHEPFLDQVSTPEARAKILEYQRAVLSRRSEIIPMLEKHKEDNGHVYRVGIDEVLDYCILELPFSTWQWGNDIDAIPSKDSDTQTLFDYLIEYSGPDYFAPNAITAFYIQASRELGYYGYDIEPLKDLLSIKDSKGYLARLFMDEENHSIEFDKTLPINVDKYLTENDDNMIFIYGEFDPWSAARAKDSYFEGKKNMLLFIEADGNHRARISTLSQGQRNQIWSQLRKWLK